MSTPSSTRRASASDGFSFVELVVATFVMLIIASAAMPIARVSIKREREAELRRDLVQMRQAIDKFKDMADLGQLAPSELRFGGENYPASLDQLVEGVTRNGDASGNKVKLLRRIPVDPMTGNSDWGYRSYQDPPDAKSWGGQNVFDVYTKMDGKALDGTKYRDW